MMNFSILNRTIKVDPNKPAIISRHTSISYLQLDNYIKKNCLYLQNKGVKFTNRVALTGRHNSEFVMMLFALWRLGAVPIPINTRLREGELSKLLDAAEPDFILSDDECKVDDDVSIIEDYNLVINGNDEGIVIFTSGSTGISKGVVLTVNNLLSSGDAANKIIGSTEFSPHTDFNPHPGPHPNPLPEGEGKEEGEGTLQGEGMFDDKWLASLPFYHIGGIMILVRAVIAGLTIIIPDSFEVKEISFLLKEFRPSFMSLVPTVFKRLLENNVYPDSEMKRVLLGGGPVTDELAREAISKGWEILKVYGSSETCSMFTAINLNEHQDKLPSAGKPLSGNKLKIVDDHREEVSVGEIGEIAVSGPTVFKEYLNNETETRQKKIDGFYFTGDLGYVDAEGYLYVISRRTDLIISGGENISPAEIEQEILKIPGVLQVCVIGLKDEEWGQIPAAAIKTTGNKNTDYIMELLRKSLAGYKLPKKIIFIDHFPVNELGKIEREQLKKYFV